MSNTRNDHVFRSPSYAERSNVTLSGALQHFHENSNQKDLDSLQTSSQKLREALNDEAKQYSSFLNRNKARLCLIFPRIVCFEAIIFLFSIVVSKILRRISQ